MPATSSREPAEADDGVVAASALLGELVTDLGQDPLLARQRRLDRLLRLPALQAVHAPHHQEQDPGDDQEIEGDGEKVSPRQHRPLALCLGEARRGHLGRQGREVVGEIEAAGHGTNHRHKDVADRGLDDLAEGGTDDDADGEVDHVALHGEFAEFLEHGSFLSEEIKVGQAWAACGPLSYVRGFAGSGWPKPGPGVKMLQGWMVVGIALAYIGFLFAVASWGERVRPGAAAARSAPFIYPLSLAVYCTSWTFFGSVGLASKQGLDFLTIYLGPVLMIGLGYPLVLKIVRLAKAQNITSIADFIAARYGKSPVVAAIVTLFRVIGAIPYIALQLKAVSSSLVTMLGYTQPGPALSTGYGDLAFVVAVTMAAFAVLFGTRHIDAHEHQRGLMLAIATESVIKLVAFLVVGIYVTFYLFAGPGDLYDKAAAHGNILSVFTAEVSPASWVTMTVLSFLCIVLLPRQFHVTVVENNSEQEVRRAAWLFPLYLVLINLFVVPIALAGLATFPAGTVDSDMFVLAVPLGARSPRWLTSGRRSSAACSGGAPRRAVPPPGSSSASQCGPTHSCCRASSPRDYSTARSSISACSASRTCGRRRCSASTRHPSPTACYGAWGSTSSPSSACRSCRRRRRSSGCRRTSSSAPRARRRRPPSAGARR